MHKSLKIIFALLSVLVIVIIGIGLSSPRISILIAINQLNSSLPIQSSFCSFERVSLTQDTITYHYTINGNEDINSFYTENYDTIRKLIMFGIIVMNGQNENGNRYSSLVEEASLHMKVDYTLPNKEHRYWIYTAQELKDFIYHLQIDPTTALYVIIDTQIKLTNLTNTNNISSEFVDTTTEPTINFLYVNRENNSIIFAYETEEIDFLKQVSLDESSIEILMNEMTQDQDIRMFATLVAMSHSNMVMRYINDTRTDSIDLAIPYESIQKHCILTFH